MHSELPRTWCWIHTEVHPRLYQGIPFRFVRKEIELELAANRNRFCNKCLRWPFIVPQSRFGDKLLRNCTVCPQNGTVVLTRERQEQHHQHQQQQQQQQQQLQFNNSPASWLTDQDLSRSSIARATTVAATRGPNITNREGCVRTLQAPGTLSYSRSFRERDDDRRLLYYTRSRARREQ